MTFNDSFHSSDTRKPATKDDSALGPVDDIEGQEVEPTTDQERLFPEMVYFEDYIGQAARTASEQRERDDEQEESQEARLLKQLEAADTLSDLMQLDDEGREWLTDALINGDRIRTLVCTDTVSMCEEADPWRDSEIIGNCPVGNLHISVDDDFGNTIGSFTLPGNWPAAEFNPDGRGRNPEDSVNGREYHESLDFAVAAAATAAGFMLDNAGEDDGSGEGYFAQVFILSV